MLMINPEGFKGAMGSKPQSVADFLFLTKKYAEDCALVEYWQLLEVSMTEHWRILNLTLCCCVK